MGLVLIALAFSHYQSDSTAFVYRYLLVAMLCIHIWFSVQKVLELKALHLLGMALLVVSATAFVSIAQQTGSFDLLIFANIMFLFLLVPMVPWGLREAVIVIFAVYSLLSLSTGLSKFRFDTETMLTLQYLMLCSGLIGLVQVVLAVRVRKNDITARFDLDRTEAHLRKLSMVDPLTGAWNRRFISPGLANLVSRFGANEAQLVYCLFDFDDFKQLNDRFGHEFGDHVLKEFCKTFLDLLKENGYILRLGGDEFALILCHPDAETFIREAIETFQKNILVNDKYNNLAVGVSYGLVTAPLKDTADLNALYRCADNLLYRQKKQRKGISEQLQTAIG